MPHLALRIKYNPELYELYSSLAIRTLALGMVNIFVPLYLHFQIGYTLREVILFYFVDAITYAVLGYFSAKIASRLGLKHMMLSSVPFFMFYLFSLINLPVKPILFYPAAIFYGLGKVFFWIPYHIDCAKSMNAQKRGTETSGIFIINNVCGFLGPLLGGFLITFVNFNFVFIISLILMVFSAMPLFFSKETYEPITVSFRKLFVKFKSRNVMAFWADGVNGYVHDVIWPLIIFGILSYHYTTLGSITSMTLLIGIVFTIFIGKLSDKVGKRRVLKVASVVNSFLWFVRITVNSLANVFFFNLLAGFVQPSYQVPFLSRTYDKANLEPEMIGEFMILRGIMVNLGAASVMLLIFLIPHLWLGLLIAALASLAYYHF